MPMLSSQLALPRLLTALLIPLVCVACSVTTPAFPGDDRVPADIAEAKASGLLSSTSVFNKTKHPVVDGEHFANFRIPALIESQAGTLLAFAEGRIVQSDHNKGPLVLRRSDDGGRSWQPLQIIARHDHDSLNNPTPVQLASGRIMVIYQRFPEDYHSRAILLEGVEPVEAGLSGPRVQTNHMIYSDDDGLNWSEPVDITTHTKRGAPVMANFTGPGPALVIQQGSHAGRIVLPSCDYVGEGGDRVFSSYATYSDDNGVSWQLSEQAHNPAGASADETQMVELADGRLMMTVRARGARMLAYSDDGGEHWSALKSQPDLPDTGAMASVVRYELFGEPVLLHTLTTGRIDGKRSRGAIYISRDNGASWPQARVFHLEGSDYASIAVLANGDIGILAELDFAELGYIDMRFLRIKPQWLLQPDHVQK